MNSRVQIVEGKMHHCGQILRRLRVEHASAFAMVGLNAHRELRNTAAQSAYRRAAFLDGKLAALWGVTGSSLCPWGYVWLCLTNEAAAHPIIVLRGALQQIDEIMKMKTELTTTVLHGDEAALRLCAFLGFHCAHEGLGSAAFSRWSRRNLMNHVRENPDIRVAAGQSYAMQVGYHHQGNA